MAKDMYASICYKDIRVEMTAEGSSWNPDIADDMVKRVKEMFADALKMIVEYEGMEMFEVDEEDIDVEVSGDPNDDA